MKQTPNCLQAKYFVGQSDLCRSRRECSRGIIKVVCCATSAFQTSSPQSFPITCLRIIKCLAWWKEVSVVPYTALKLSWAPALRCYPESSARVMTRWFQQVQGSTVMSWLRQAGRRWLQSVDEEPKLSIPFDFRKYLLFRRDILLFTKNTSTVKFSPNTLYMHVIIPLCHEAVDRLC